MSINAKYQFKPLKINIPSKVIDISIGNSHSIALEENGDVFGWGSNSNGQLGFASLNIIKSRMQLKVPPIKQIACGSTFTIMLSIDGDIYYCGHIDDCLSHNIPTQLNSNTKFIKIAATIHSDLCVALSEDNKCYIFGNYGNYLNRKSVKELHQTEFKSIDETFAVYEQITYQTLKN